MKEKKSRKSQILSILLAFVMVCGFIAMPPVDNVVSAATMSIGQYMIMGTFEGRPIVWRAVASDSNGLLMIADTPLKNSSGNNYSLCYDAGYSANLATGSHSRDTRYRQSTSVTYGSNYWADSTLRSWLMSTAAAGNVNWLCGNPPSSGKIDGTPYSTWAGFLSGFTAAEQNAMKSVTQKQVLNPADATASIKNGGTTYYGACPSDRSTDASGNPYPVTELSKNLDTSYYQNVTDKIFLPNPWQVLAMYNNRSTLGNSYYYNGGAYWIVGPTSGAACRVISVRATGNVGWGDCGREPEGVRPAFYLNTSTNFTAGNGTAADPYTVRSRTATGFNGSTSFTKTYGDAAFSLGQSAVSGGALTYKSSDTNIATVATNGTVTIKKTGSVNITVTAAAVPLKYYSGNSRTVTVKINKANGVMTTPTTTFNKTYGDAAFELGTTINNTEQTKQRIYASNNTNVIAMSTNSQTGAGIATIKGAGTAVISVAANATTNYNAAPTKQITINVAQAQGAITTPTTTFTKTYGVDTTFAVGATLNNTQQKLTYSSSDTNVATVDANGTVTTKNVGTATITVSAAATTNYKAAANKTVTVTVNGAVPGKPGLEAQTGQPAMVTLTWTAPSYLGGFPITAYNITKRVEGSGEGFGPVATISAGGSAAMQEAFEQSIYVDKNVVDGTFYEYRIRAMNSVGYSEWSDIKVAQPNSPAGGALYLMAEGSSNTSIKLTWERNSNNGGTFVDMYRITTYADPEHTQAIGEPTIISESEHTGENTEHSNGSFRAWTYEVDINGLEQGKTYYFGVDSHNDAGWNNGDGPSLSKTEGQSWMPPAKVENPLAVVNGKNSMEIRWDPPKTNGGTVVTLYRIFSRVKDSNDEWQITEITPDAARVSEEDMKNFGIIRKMRTTVKNLTQGLEYEFYVKAANASTDASSLDGGEASDSVYAIPAQKPDAPIVGKIESRNRGVNFTSLTADNCGNAIIAYNIYTKDQNGDYQRLTRLLATDEEIVNKTATNLVNGQTYEIAVSAENAYGEGEKSDPTEVTIGLPTTPKNFKLTPKPGQVLNISYSPSDGQGSPVTHYYLYIGGQIEGEDAWSQQIYEGNNAFKYGDVIDASLSTEYALNASDRLNGDKITVFAVAVNEYGASDPTVVLESNVGAPSAPALTKYTTAKDNVYLEWLPSDANGNAISGYTVYIRDEEANKVYLFDGGKGKKELYDLTVKNGTDKEGAFVLTAGTKYTMWVVCTNGAGDSLPSNSVTFTFAAPEKPGTIETETGDGTLTVRWTEPANNGGYKIEGYNIYLNTDETPTMMVKWTRNEETQKYQLLVRDCRKSDAYLPYGAEQDNLDSFSVTIGELANGYAYTASVRAVNSKGEGSATVTEKPQAPKTKASAPVDITAAAVSGTEVKLTWKHPLSDGGSPVTSYVVKGYQVAALDANGSYVDLAEPKEVYSASITGTEATAGGLTAGGAYQFKVAAVTLAEAGEEGESNIAKTHTRPSKPVITALDSEVGDSESLKLKVTWKAPENDGGSPITGYDILLGGSFLMNIDGRLGADTREYTIDDRRIKRGNSYGFSVMAYNDVTGSISGNGVESDQEFVTIGTVPAPKDIELSVTKDAGLRVTWPMAQYAGMEQYIDRYVIYVNGRISTTVRTNEAVIDFLRQDEVQKVQVSVISTFGQEGNKSEIYSITLGAPSIVQNIEATAKFEGAGVSWDEVKSNVSASVIASTTGYNVYLDGVLTKEIRETGGVIPTSCELTELTGGKTYKLSVSALNKNGESVLSEAVTFTPWGKPTNPTIDKAIPGQGSFTAELGGGSGNGGIINGYDVYVDGEKVPEENVTKQVDFNTDKVSLTVTGVTDGVEHRVVVVAKTDKGAIGVHPGDDDYLSGGETVIVTGVPMAPGHITAVAGLGEMRVGFDKSADISETLRVTGYQILREAKADDESEEDRILKTVERTEDEVYSVLVDGLTNGEVYKITVRAVSDQGAGAESAAVTVVPGTPMAPIISSITPRGGQLNVEWSVPQENAGRVTRYAVYVDGVEAVTTPETNAVLTGLENGKSYVVTVSAYNYVGEGAKSDPVIATPGGTPDVVSNVKAQATYSAEKGHGIVITWDAPVDDGGIVVTEYFVNGDSKNIRVDSANRTAVIDGLTEGTAYTFSIIARNNAGDGPAYTTEEIKTFTAPGAPELQELNSYNNALIIKWTAPQDTGGTTIDKYRVYAEDMTAGGITEWDTDILPDENGEYTAEMTAVENNLITGNTYKVSVAAINVVGEGEKSAGIRTKLNDNLVTSAPGKPLNIAAEASDGQVTITWEAPAKDGNSTITSYIIYGGDTADNMEPVSTVNGYTFTFTESNLRNGTERFYKVKAMNAADANGGPFSDTVSATPVKINPPSAPTWPVFSDEGDGVSAYEVNASGSQMKIVWNASTGDEAGGKITYRVYVDGNPAGEATEDTFFILTNLKENTRYNIRVTAMNELGGESTSEYIRAFKNLNIRMIKDQGFEYAEQYTGIFANIDADYNGEEDTQISYGVPSEPIDAAIEDIVDETDGKTKGHITWKTPASDGNTPIRGYYVDVNGQRSTVNLTSAAAEGGNAQGDVYEFDFEIAYGEPYVAYVRAYNSLGEGKTTDPLYISLATDPPAGLTAKISETDKRHIVLTWEDPNAGVTGYKIWVDGKATTIDKSDITENTDGTVSYTYTDGVVNHNYIFAISALYNEKMSVQSEAVEIETLDAPAEAPANVAITETEAGSGVLTVSWTAPGNIAADDIEKYVLYINGEPQNDISISGTDTSVEITPSVNVGESILVKLQAVSVYGTEGALSEPVKYTREEQVDYENGAPAAPTNLAAEILRENNMLLPENNVTVTWTQPDPTEAFAGVVQMYRVYIGGEFKSVVMASTPTYTFTAEPGKDYDVSVEPDTGMLKGPKASIVVQVPANEYAKPEKPVLEGQLADDKKTITFTWNEVADVDYYLIVNGDQEIMVPANSGTYTYTFTPGSETEYAFILKAVKDYGNDITTEERSNMVQVSIAENETGTYLSNKAEITGTVSNNNKVKIFWNLPEKKADELGEIEYFKVVADGTELSGQISPADIMSTTLEFNSISEKKEVRVRAYKMVSGKPFCASTSDVWIATPSCNVIDDKDTFDDYTDTNPPFDDNGNFKPDVPVNNKDTEGTGETNVDTGVEIRIPIVINRKSATVKFVDQYNNTILETDIAAKDDGSNEIVFAVDKSESELSELIFNIVISEKGATSYTLKGIPFSDLSLVNLDVELALGDLNGDGKVTVIDKSLITKNLNKSNQTLETGDLNGDGKITVIDKSLIAKYLNKSSKVVTWSK